MTKNNTSLSNHLLYSSWFTMHAMCFGNETLTNFWVTAGRCIFYCSFI